jgi:threonine dehydratase
MQRYAASLESVREAARRIAPYAQRTPVMTNRTLDRLAGRALFFKCEMLQRGGAFKFRGACNAVMKLDDDVAARGVVTHSSGNYAQALAIAAGLRGIAAYVVMPKNAPSVKRRAVEGYGARVFPCEPTLEAREAEAARVARETGATLLPPFDHADVIAGQGTLALELLEQAPKLDAIVAPLGGGGLLSGIAIAAKALRPELRVYGAEPEAADDAARSKAAGQLVPVGDARTIADGLRTSLGALTWPVVRDLVDAVFTVSDAAIVAAMRLVWERMKLVAEPSAVVGLAVGLGEPFRALSGLERVGVVLSGGNVDLDALPF